MRHSGSQLTGITVKQAKSETQIQFCQICGSVFVFMSLKHETTCLLSFDNAVK